MRLTTVISHLYSQPQGGRSHNEYSGLISFRMDWLDLLAVQGTLKSLLQHHSSEASILRCSAFFIVQHSSMAAVYSFQKPWQNLNCNQADPANQHSIMPSLSHSDWLSYGHMIQRSPIRVSPGTFDETTMKEAPHFFQFL